MSGTVMSASIRANLLSLQNTTAQMDKTQANLSTGKKINSALDGANSYFAARALNDRAKDLNNLLDAMGQSISSLKQASNGVDSLNKLVDQANAIAGQARDDLAMGAQEAKVAGTVNLKDVKDLTTLAGVANGNTLTFTANDKDGKVALNAVAVTIATGDSIDELITKINDVASASGDRVVEAKLNDAGKLELKALDGGSFSMTVDGGATTAADLALAQALGFGDSAEKVANGTLTSNVQNYDVKITANAAAALNSRALYSAAGTLAKASDALTALYNTSVAASGDTLITATTVDSGDKLKVGFNGGTQKEYAITGLTVQGLVDKINADFEGKLAASFDGSTGKINIRSTDAKVETVEFGVLDETTTNGLTASFGFGVQDDIAATADTADATNVESIRLGAAAAKLAVHEADYNKVRAQIDSLVKDAGYRGTNLLNGDTLLTVFNEDRSTSIATTGKVLTSAGLGLDAANFGNAAGVDSALEQGRTAVNTLRSFASSLANDMNVIQTRQDYTKQTINTLEEGSDKLTVADPNEEGATMLALQTRQQLAVSALSLASQAQQAVLSLLR